MTDGINIHSAFQYYSAGKINKAHEIVNKLLQEEPDNIDLKLLTAAIFAAKKDYLNVIRSCDSILELDANNDKAYSNAAVASQMLSKHHDAINYVTKLLSINPEHIHAVLIYISSMRALGNLNDVITFINNLDGEVIENPAIASEAAKSYYDAHDYDKAMTCFARSSKYNEYAAESHHYLGDIYDKKGDLVAAVKSYMQVLNINPNSIPTIYNIALILTKQGDSVRSLEYLVSCIKKGNSIDAKQAFTRILPSAGINYINDEVKEIIIDILKDDSIESQAMSNAVKDYIITRSAYFRELYDSVSNNNQADTDVNLLISKVSNNPLFLHLLSNVLITDYKFECLIDYIRGLILRSYIQCDRNNEEKLINLCSCIALQCELSGYIYSISDEEKSLLKEIVENIDSFQKSSRRSCFIVTILSMYEPLYELKYKFSISIPKYKRSEYFINLRKLQFEDKKRENDILVSLKDFGNIKDQTSQNVAMQYEDSPYPVWRKINYRTPKLVCDELSNVINHNDCNTLPINTAYPDTLIAGCGTGKHAIQHVLRFKVNSIDAIDLSKNSLAYANRMSEELHIENITFQKLDILDVALLEKKYDVIETVGVLHHMDNPMDGLNKLLKCLKSGGLLNIGLYSEKGRRHILKAKSIYHKNDGYLSDEEIRYRRKKILESDDNKMIENLTGFYEFFSLHECRDMIFHVQEHDYTIPMIKDLLEYGGLEFLGFEFSGPVIPVMYKKQYANDTLMRDLNNWEVFEEENPDTFSEMYVFWCKKK